MNTLCSCDSIEHPSVQSVGTLGLVIDDLIAAVHSMASSSSVKDRWNESTPLASSIFKTPEVHGRRSIHVLRL